MKNMNNLFVIRYGTEVRIFFNDYFPKKNGQSYALIKKPAGKEIIEYIKAYNINPIYLETFPKIGTRLYSLFNSSRISRNKRMGIKNYKHYSKGDNSLEIKDVLKGNILTFNALKILLKIYLRIWRSEKIESLLPVKNSNVFFAGYSSPELIAIAASAKKLKNKNIVVINSWKDYYVNNFVPPVFDEIWVWNEKMKGLYLKNNPHISKDLFKIKGNPRLSALSAHIPANDFSFYKNKYKISKDKFVLYTAVNPKVYEKEPEIVLNLLKSQNNTDYHFLIKTNPMDLEPERWRNVAESFQNVSIVYSDWSWNETNEINVPGMASETEWFDLLNYCIATSNVASTVTIESIIVKKAVINICFNENNEINDIFREITFSDFYSHVLNRQGVIIANSFEEFWKAFHSIHEINADENLNDLIVLNA